MKLASSRESINALKVQHWNTIFRRFSETERERDNLLVERIDVNDLQLLSLALSVSKWLRIGRQETTNCLRNWFYPSERRFLSRTHAKCQRMLQSHFNACIYLFIYFFKFSSYFFNTSVLTIMFSRKCDYFFLLPCYQNSHSLSIVAMFTVVPLFFTNTRNRLVLQHFISFICTTLNTTYAFNSLTDVTRIALKNLNFTFMKMCFIIEIVNVFCNI